MGSAKTVVRTVFPALSKPKKRILAFLCNSPCLERCEIELRYQVDAHTELSEDVPEPVDDEHDDDGRGLRIKYTSQL